MFIKVPYYNEFFLKFLVKINAITYSYNFWKINIKKMIKNLKKSEYLFSFFKKKNFEYISSLPTKQNRKSFEEIIKKEFLSAFEINPRLKSILENEDTEDETLKRRNKIIPNFDKL